MAGAFVSSTAGQGGGASISVTVGSDGFFDPKSGAGSSISGYANAANSISGSTVGGVSPTTVFGATINALYYQTTLPGGATTLYLLLAGDQTALGITRSVIDGTARTFGAPVFGGGQTSWSVSASGASFSTNPDTVRIS